MSNFRRETDEGFTDESNERFLKLQKLSGKMHDGHPVKVSVRGKKEDAVSVGSTLHLQPVRISESIDRERITYGNAIAKMLGWGAERTIETESVGISDDGTLVFGDMESVLTLERSLQPTPERIGPAALLIAKKTDDVRSDLFMMRHALHLPIERCSSESIRSSFVEDIHPQLTYTIAADAVPDGFTYDGKTGVLAMELYLENEVKLGEIWKRLCALTGRQKPIPSFSILLNARKESMGAAICSIVDIHYEHRNGQRRKATSFSSTPMRGLALSLENHRNDTEEFECTLVHELAHMLTNGLPHNEMLREGLAEAVVALYGEVYEKRNVRTQGTDAMRPAVPGKTLEGMLTPTCAGPIEELHTVLGWAGASMFLSTLGTTTDERLANLRHVISASSETSNDVAGKNVTFKGMDNKLSNDIIRKLPTVQEWIENVDRVRPGLGRTIASHPVMQPIDKGGIAVFFPHGKNDPWGTIAAFSYVPNNSFGFSKSHASYMSNTPDDYDWNGGDATPLAVEICITDVEGKNYKTTNRGIVALTPPMACMHMRVPLRAFDRGVTVEYRIDGGEWVRTGENVKLSDEDRRAYFFTKRGKKKMRQYMKRFIGDVRRKKVDLHDIATYTLRPPKTVDEIPVRAEAEGASSDAVVVDHLFRDGSIQLGGHHAGEHEHDDYFAMLPDDPSLFETDEGTI